MTFVILECSAVRALLQVFILCVAPNLYNSSRVYNAVGYFYSPFCERYKLIIFEKRIKPATLVFETLFFPAVRNSINL